MSQKSSDWGPCVEFNGFSGRGLLALLLVVGGVLLLSNASHGAEPPERSRGGNWLKLFKLPTRSSEAAAEQRRAPSTSASRPYSRPTGSATSVRQAAARAHSSGLVKPPKSSGILPVAGQSLDKESSRVVPANAGDEPMMLDIPPTPEAALSGATSSEMTLEMLTALADSHHPRLTAAYQRVQAAQGRAVQAGLYPNPKLAFSSPQLDGNESQYNGFVSQEFVTAGKLKLSVAAVRQEVSQAEFAWQQERFFVLTDLRQKFFATLAAQSRIAVLENLVQIARRSQDTSQKLLKAGEGTRGDTLLLDIEFQRAEVSLKNAQTRYEIGKRQLGILVAVPDLAIETLSGDLDARTRAYDVEEVRSAVASVNPLANIARLEIDRNEYLLRRACVEPIPNIDIMGGYQRQVGVPAQNQGLFQVTMSIPLWNKNQGNIAAAEAELFGSHADLQRVELQLANTAADAVANFRTAEQLVERYESQILPKARETLQLSQNLYAQGQIDFLRLLQAQKTLLDVELARIDAQEQRWVAAAAIAGLLQEEAFP